MPHNFPKTPFFESHCELYRAWFYYLNKLHIFLIKYNAIETTHCFVKIQLFAPTRIAQNTLQIAIDNILEDKIIIKLLKTGK